MAVAANNTANVSVGKGVKGGYFFTAPAGTALPTDYTTALPETFVNVGYLSDEGITNSMDADSETFQDLNGDDVATSNSGITRTVGLQFIEVNERSLKEVYGQDNVTVTPGTGGASGTIAVQHNNTDMPHRVGVAELVLRDGRRWRRVYADMQVIEWDDMTYVSSELVMLPVTYTLNADGTGNYIYDYIEQPA